MVSGPYLPGLTAVMIPPTPVRVKARANVAHGADRVHGLLSTPDDETNVSASPWAKAAVTLSAALMVTTQLPLPLHAPLQPLKNQPLAGVSVSVTCVPLAKLALQVEPQLIPDGVLVTVPLPDTPAESVYASGAIVPLTVCVAVCAG